MNAPAAATRPDVDDADPPTTALATRAWGRALVLAACAACGPVAATPDASVPTTMDAAVDAPVAPVDDGDDGDDGASAATTPQEQQAWRRLLALAQGEMTAGNAPGASVAVVLHGHVAFAAGLGVSDTDTGAPVTTATRFRAASMSKMVLAATAMSLVRDGALDLDQPITRYVPWFHLAAGFDASSITLAHLLSHTAGFPCDTLAPCDPGASGPRRDFFAANPQPLWAPPGAVFDYSNVGFALAAEVLAAAAGRSDDDFATLVRERVFAPAGMATATYDTAAAAAGDHATGYDLDASGRVAGIEPINAVDCPLLRPPGGVMATATDYARFAEMLLANGAPALDARGVAAMESPHVALRTFGMQSYGYGLFSQRAPFADHALVWHGGTLPGFLSQMLLVPDLGFAVVVLTNASGPTDVSNAIANDALGLFVSELESWPDEHADPSTWSGYAGTYDDAHGLLGAGVVVAVRAGSDGGAPTLTIDAPGARDFAGHARPLHGALQQVLGDECVLPDGTAATFFPDASGRFRYLVTREGIAVR